MPKSQALESEETEEIEKEDDLETPDETDLETPDEIGKEKEEQDLEGADDLEVGKRGGEVEGKEALKEGEEEEPENETGKLIEALREENKELRERFEKFESRKDEEARAPKEPTEEEWLKIEDEWGGTNRKTIKQVQTALGAVARAVISRLEGRLSRFEKEAAVNALSTRKGFEDIRKFSGGIDEFLKDYSPDLHADEKLLMKAYYYGKGKGAGEATRKAVSKREIGRKIMGKVLSHGRPGGGRGGTVKGLTPIQKEAAHLAGMSEEEYMDSLNGKFFT